MKLNRKANESWGGVRILTGRGLSSTVRIATASDRPENLKFYIFKPQLISLTIKNKE